MFCEIIGTGTPVLLLHGYGVDRRLMTGCFEPVFAKAPGYRRFYVDMPGMGNTPAGDVKNADDMLAAIVEFVETVMPAGPFLLAGESYGGYMAQGLMALMPERILGVLLLCGVVEPIAAKRRVPRHTVLRDTLGDRVDEDLRRMFDEYAVARTPDALHRYQRDILPGIKAGDKEFIRWFSPGRRYPFVKTPAFREYNGPSLVIAGRQDTSVGYEDAFALLAKMPRASYAALDMAGHNLQIEQPALFEALAGEWLARVEIAAANGTA